MQLKHQYDQEDAILKAQLDSGLDADRAAIEAEREGMKLEGEAQSMAIKLDGERAKLAVQKAKDNMELNKKDALNRIAVASARQRAMQQPKPEQQNGGDEE